MTGEVTILIPAYAAEAFIDQTLHFARGQTFREIEISVSVDRFDDTTFERVQQHARSDKRVRAYRQPERLGWAGNVNFLLDQVRTPYCFIYFHDDILLPNYVERLLPTLKRDASAALVHCDVRYIGAATSVLRARENARPLRERLLQFMLAPDRGAPLRGIIRRDVMGDVRLPDDAPQALYANEIFLLEAAVRGPLLAEREILYINWANRPDGLVARWNQVSAEGARAGVRSILDRAAGILGRAAVSEAERDQLRFASFLWLKRFIDDAETRAGARLYQRPSDLHPSFDAAAWPVDLTAWPSDISGWAAARWETASRDLAARLRT